MQPDGITDGAAAHHPSSHMNGSGETDAAATGAADADMMIFEGEQLSPSELSIVSRSRAGTEHSSASHSSDNTSVRHTLSPFASEMSNLRSCIQVWRLPAIGRPAAIPVELYLTMCMS